MTMQVEAIGIVQSPVKEGIDENWGAVESTIQMREELTAGLQGLEQFSHITVVFYMDRATFNPATDLIRRPQGRPDMPEVGIFAQRAKHRPNPIGTTAVKLVAVQGNRITVRGLDAIDGTPVLDVKPYYPQYDRVDNPTIPAWVQTLMDKYF